MALADPLTPPGTSRAAPLGVVLINLGSPDAPTPEALHRYLDEFLSDPRVVDLPRWLWLPLLRGFILPRRCATSARLYARVWGPEGGPLLAITRQQAQALQEALGDSARVVVGMRYGQPSLTQALEQLRDNGCERLLCVPMFPQFAGATVGSALAQVDIALEAVDWQPQRQDVPPHYAAPGYLDALTSRTRETLEAVGPVDMHLFSFHGIPMSQVRRGDPYPEHCRATAEALASRLELKPDEWSLVFQSRFGPAAWLQPYAEDVVRALANTHPRVLVSCPGFTADCLETLDEIGDQLAASFLAAGGARLDLVPCLNTHPAWIAALVELVEQTAVSAHP